MKATLMEFVRAVPATGRLLYRVLRDERVAERRRLAVLAAFGYAVLPIDLIPDRLPIVGKLDDIVIVAATLRSAFEAAGDDILREHWDASEESLQALLSVVDTVAGFMPKAARRLLRLEA